MKILISESQYKLILNETIDVKTIKDINWYGLLSYGRKVWEDKIKDIIKIDDDFYPYFTKVMVSLGRIKNEIESDVLKGSLSQTTINKFNQNLMSSLVTISKDKMLSDTINRIPSAQRTMAKSIVGKGIIKSSIDKAVNLTGKSFFIEGMSEGLKKYYNQNSPIVKNYITVLNQMGMVVSTNENLKKNIQNVVMSVL